MLTALSAGGMLIGTLGLIWTPLALIILFSPDMISPGPLSPTALGVVFLLAGLVSLLIGAVSLISFVYNARKLRRLGAESHEAYIRDVTR